VVSAIVAQVESTDAFATKRSIHALLANCRTCIFTLTEDEARALFDSVAMGTGLTFLAPLGLTGLAGLTGGTGHGEGA
jgi:hypothetical protein